MVGLEVVGAHGSLQINENYENLYLTQKGTISILTGLASTPYTIDIAGNMPLLFIGPTTTDAHIVVAGRVLISASVWRYTLYAHSLNNPSSFLVNIPYYIFDVTVPTDSGFGLQVFKANGELAFDSGSKFLRIKQVIQMTSIANSYTVGPNSIAMIDSTVFWIQQTSGSSSAVFGTCVRVNGNNVTTRGGAVVSPNSTPAYVPPEYLPRIIVADSTNL